MQNIDIIILSIEFEFNTLLFEYELNNYIIINYTVTTNLGGILHEPFSSNFGNNITVDINVIVLFLKRLIKLFITLTFVKYNKSQN